MEGDRQGGRSVLLLLQVLDQRQAFLPYFALAVQRSVLLLRDLSKQPDELLLQQNDRMQGVRDCFLVLA